MMRLHLGVVALASVWFTYSPLQAAALRLGVALNPAQRATTP